MSNQHSHDSHDDVRHHIRRYLMVFGALIVGTVFTVWASYIDLGHHWNIILALVIASVKAFLVAGFFMHLVSEKKMIFSILAFTGFFFVGLMFLTIWSMAHGNAIHISNVP